MTEKITKISIQGTELDLSPDVADPRFQYSEIKYKTRIPMTFLENILRQINRGYCPNAAIYNLDEVVDMVEYKDPNISHKDKQKTIYQTFGHPPYITDTEECFIVSAHGQVTRLQEEK